MITQLVYLGYCAGIQCVNGFVHNSDVAIGELKSDLRKRLEECEKSKFDMEWKSIFKQREKLKEKEILKNKEKERDFIKKNKKLAEIKENAKLVLKTPLDFGIKQALSYRYLYHF